MTSTLQQAQREPKLTLRDTTDLFLSINRWVEEHVDEVELNAGALPDDLAELLDQVDAAQHERADALAAKLDEFTGYVATARATKDRAARRQRVWENTISAIKAYVLRELDRLGVDRIRGATAVLRAQRNSQPSVECSVDAADLLLLADGTPARPDHARLLPFLTVQRTATIDKKKLAAAYERRCAELEREVQLLGESDIPDEYASRLEELARHGVSRRHAIASLLDEMRRQYIAHALDAEFPFVSCVRGVHLRID
jgi:hypothetical protein